MSKVKVGRKLYDVEELKKGTYEVYPLVKYTCSIEGCKRQAEYIIIFPNKAEISIYSCKEHVKLFAKSPEGI